MVRRLEKSEIDVLLAQAIPLRLATIDGSGYPHVTPLWFIQDAGSIVVTSFEGRAHVARARANKQVGLVIDVEAALRPDGERPNQQIRMVGDAEVAPDLGGEWTSRIRRRYIDAQIAPGVAERVDDGPRVLIRVHPRSLVAVSSV